VPDTTPKFHRIIAKRLIISVILFSTVITLISSSIQLYRDYATDVDQINRYLQEINDIHLNTIARAVWVADYRSVENLIEGLQQLPSIEYLEVHEESKQIAAMGTPQLSNFLERKYALEYVYNNESRLIGYLRVQASLNQIYRSLLNKAFVIVVSNAIKTFLVSGLLLYLIYYLVTRHLQKLAHYASRLNLNNLDESLSLERPKNHETDELDVVVDAINLMRSNLLESIAVLRESAQRYRTLIETTTAIPWEYSLHLKKFTYVGPQAVSLLGFPQDQWEQPQFRENQIHPEDRAAAIAAFNSIIHQTKEGEVEYRFADADGRYVDIREHIKVIAIGGEEKSVSGFMFDITKKNSEHRELTEYRNNLENLVRQRTLELEIINKELEAFCYSVSHDLRAPLRAIFGFSQALQEDFSDKLNDLGVNYLERVQKASLRMGHIIDDLLRLSRITRAHLQIDSIDFSNLAKSAMAQLELIFDTPAPQLIVEDNLFVRGDRGLLSVVLENLIGNAWKYANPDVTPMVTVGSKIIDGETVYFVTDNGIGFDMRYYEKLFAVFQRLHTNEKLEGSGIGLATVQRIIERHGGRIWAESRLNQGSTFYFTLKASQEHKLKSERENSPPSVASSSL